MLEKEDAKPGFNPQTFIKHDIPLSVTEKGYALLQLLAALALTLAILLSIGKLPLGEQLAWCGILVIYLTSLGLVLERKSFAWFIEVAKWSILLIGFICLSAPAWAAITMATMAGISCVWLLLAKNFLTAVQVKEQI